MKNTKLVIISLILSVVGIVITFLTHQQAMHTFLNLAEANRNAFQLSQNITYYDEVLTMTARMIALTGESHWSERYPQYAKLIDQDLNTLKQHNQLAGVHPTIQSIVLANKQLLEIEGSAIRLAKLGQHKEAYQLVNSETYELQKNIYQKNLLKLRQHIQNQIEINQQDAKSKIYLAGGLVLLLGLFLTLSNLYFSAQMIKNQKALEYINKNLDQLAEMKSKELEAEKQMTLNSAKMVTIGEMAGTIAHDISNPLAVVNARNQRLLKLVYQDPINRNEIEKNILSIASMTFRIQKLVQNIKDFARNDRGEAPQETAIQEMVLECLELLEEKARKKSVIIDTTQILKTHQHLLARNQITQILVNLISNAIDAASPSRDATVKIQFVTDEQNFGFEVWDSGEGIPESLRLQIFEPLFTTKPKGSGTGLGLSIVKRLVEHLAGHITYYRKEGWTVFAVQFPQKKSSDQIENPSSKAA